MPMVTINILQGKGEAYGRAVADAVNRVVIDTMAFPEDDRYQVINELPEYALQIQERKGDRAIINLVMRSGRSDEAKKAFYRQVAEALSVNPGIPKENIVINFSENKDVDWSFANGKASFLDEPELWSTPPKGGLPEVA